MLLFFATWARLRESSGGSAMRFIIGAAAAWLAASAAQAQSIRAEAATVVDYGTYAVEDSSVTTDEQGVKQHYHDNLSLIERTNTVPLRLGVTFGFRYMLSGTTNSSSPIRQITIYPSGGLVAPVKSRIDSVEQDTTVQIGDTGLIDYTLEDPWELVPGVWTLEVRAGDKLLASESFTLVAQ